MLPVQLANDLPKQAYTAKMVRENEPKVAEMLSINMYQLMNMAGSSSFALANKLWPQAKTIVVFCGSGNNAGDGFVVARLAMQSGIKVYLCSMSLLDSFTGDARLAMQHFIKAGGCSINLSEIDFTSVDYIVDGLLGTGINGDVRPDYAAVIKQINQRRIPVLALDIPSGLNPDTGRPNGIALKSTATITFVAVKQGMLTGVAKDYCGDIYLSKIDIGSTFSQVITSTVFINSPHFFKPLRPRKPSAHKGDSGFVIAIAGNKPYPGAARLCCEAALRSGAGLVGLICHPDNRHAIVSSRPEIMLLNTSEYFKGQLVEKQKANVILLGPGLGQDQWAKEAFEAIINTHLPMVVDADALNLLANTSKCNQHWILTPHPKEAARLLNCQVSEVEADRFLAVRRIAQKYGGICILKGAGTLISDGSQVIINITGNQGMASGGMGDVLSGIIASMCLQTSSLLMAACHGVYLHGKAGDIASQKGQIGLLASDLFSHIRTLVNQH